MPVHLHLKKMLLRSAARTATLSDTHPLRALLRGGHCKTAERHSSSVEIPVSKDYRSPIIALDEMLCASNLEFIYPGDAEAKPGHRLLDLPAEQSVEVRYFTSDEIIGYNRPDGASTPSAWSAGTSKSSGSDPLELHPLEVFFHTLRTPPSPAASLLSGSPDPMDLIGSHASRLEVQPVDHVTQSGAL